MSNLLGTENHFNYDELFFSRTDRVGVILAANSVFKKISKFDWNELLYKPHKIIRHPAMPRGVFQLFWDTLYSGKPIGAYVVNKAKDGTYYWVFGLAFPVEDGFISIRLKPSGPYFETVKAAYAQLLELEKTKKLTPSESKEILLSELRKLNFRDYDHFMTEALTTELESRQSALGKPPIKTLQQLQDVTQLGKVLQSECKNIFTSYSNAALVPLNLELQAARIGAAAAPLAAISTQYDKIAKQINDDIKKLLDAVNSLQDLSSQSCKFDVCSLMLVREVIEVFRLEKPLDNGVDKALEMNLLKTVGQKNYATSIKNLALLESEFRKFNALYEEVKKQAAALEIVNISGKVEAVKIAQANELMSLLQELNVFKTNLKESLKVLNGSGLALIQEVHFIKDNLKSAA